MIKNVTLVGRLTRDPELRYTGNGTAVVSFTIAADRPFTNNQGEREADFINCVAWRRTAEVVSNYTNKGSLVGVTGRIQTRSYENNEGRTVYVTEVVVENFRMLESKATAENRRSNDDYSNGGFNNNQSFNQSRNNQSQNQNSFSSNNKFDNDPFDTSNDDDIDISDDDLPF